MRFVVSLILLALNLSAAYAADERIYRCGNEYTKTVSEDQAKTCKLISGSNVTVIQAVKVPPKGSGTSGARVDAVEQRAKDADARLILESELKRAEARQAELLKEYNNGEPERQGGEARNNQKYLDRVDSLKAAIARNDADIAGIKRELGRLSPPSGPAAGASSNTMGR